MSTLTSRLTPPFSFGKPSEPHAYGGVIICLRQNDNSSAAKLKVNFLAELGNYFIKIASGESRRGRFLSLTISSPASSIISSRRV